MNYISVAIDGPAGAGKSTIAKKLAAKLQCTYIDTGAMYRTVGYYCIQQGIDYNNEQQTVEALRTMHIQMKYENNTQLIYLNEENVSDAIRTQEVATAASKVATYIKVREGLVQMQQMLAKQQSVVMDGRDIGTVVLQDATLKIFLTASPEERAKRRYIEYQQKGLPCDFDALVEEIKARDTQDTTRQASPLRQAEDAVVIDSTTQSIDEVVESIYTLLGQKG